MILAFDTSGDQLTVALGTAREIVAARHEPAPRAHLSSLIPTIDTLLEEAGLAIRDVEYLAVGVGPGSFTGLRIGVATARGLAQAAGKPLIGVSSLDILAQSAAIEPTGADLIYPITDAKRGEVYTAVYENDGRRLGEYRVTRPETLARELAGLEGTAVLVGDGLARYGALFKETAHSGAPEKIDFAPESAWLPNALVLIKLAEERILLEKGLPAGQRFPYGDVLPMYLRLPEAEENLLREK